MNRAANHAESTKQLIHADDTTSARGRTALDNIQRFGARVESDASNG